MSKLKELTWANHSKAERTNHASKLLKGMSPQEYHRYLYNQYVQYAAIESIAQSKGVLDGIEDIARAPAILTDIEELENEYSIQRNVDLLCSVVNKYANYVVTLENADDILAHLYVRHFGDMYGGQMIRKRNPGAGSMYDFNNVDELKSTVRAKLTDDMADEANTCFEFAMQLFEELDEE
jgi:heme oxygenase|tara:strand:+ start:654 stop:1193 length:540 start_codon:yes stop_codon:yes gene_type:complete